MRYDGSSALKARRRSSGSANIERRPIRVLASGAGVLRRLKGCAPRAGRPREGPAWGPTSWAAAAAAAIPARVRTKLPRAGVAEQHQVCGAPRWASLATREEGRTNAVASARQQQFNVAHAPLRPQLAVRSSLGVGAHDDVLAAWSATPRGAGCARRRARPPHAFACALAAA